MRRLQRITTIAAFARITQSKLTVASERGVAETFASSTYNFFGPREGSVLDSEVVFLRNDEVEEFICGSKAGSSETLRRRVHGKVVIYMLGCELSRTYDKLERAGAVAHVSLAIYNPPGLFAFSRDRWSTEAYRNRAMIMSDVSLSDVSKEVLASWKTSSMQGWRVTIAPPYLRVYEG